MTWTRRDFQQLASTNTRFDPMRFTQAVVTGKETT